jgi:hypothetical protein
LGPGVARAIKTGWAQVNQGLGQIFRQSYGGYKESGIGREFSLEGMLESCTQKEEHHGQPGALTHATPTSPTPVYRAVVPRGPV